MLLRRLASLAFAAVVACAAVPGAVQADEAHCNSDKLKSLHSAVAFFLRCSAQAVGAADPPDPDCTTEADTRLAAGFARAQEDPECAASGEVPAIAAALHALEEDLRTLVVVTADGRRCASGKMRVATMRAKKELTCRRRAAITADPPDPDCTARARDGLTEGFAYREQHGSCETTGDAPQAEALVADFLILASSMIDGSYEFPAPSGLAAVVNGNAVELSWTAPEPSSGLTHARVLRVLNTAATGPNDPAGTVVFDGQAEDALDSLNDLLPNTSSAIRVYHYTVYGCDAVSSCEANGSHTTLTPTVRQVLIAGGYVVHWRHAAADVCSDNQTLGTADVTSYPDWWKRCDSFCPTPETTTATARQLNNTGRADATAIGDAFGTLGIAIGRVLTSEYCRNVETAQLLDFGPAIEESLELTYWVYDEASRCADTFVLLGEAPTAGTNTALIGHAGNVCPPLSLLAWGEAAIYKPDGIGGATYIERVLKDAWLALP